MRYYRHPHRDTWHWRIVCSSFRRMVTARTFAGLVRVDRKPTSGELCNQCLAQARRG